MGIQKGTLVAYHHLVSHGDGDEFGDIKGFGIVEGPSAEENCFRVRTQEGKYYDIFQAGLFPLAQTDGQENPQIALMGHLPEIILAILFQIQDLRERIRELSLAVPMKRYM